MTLPSDGGRTEGLASCRRCKPSTPTEEPSRIRDPSSPRYVLENNFKKKRRRISSKLILANAAWDASIARTAYGFSVTS